MDPFPLLSLPETDLQKLLNEFHVNDLFHLAQSSRKALNVVKTYALSLQEARFIINFTTETNPQINLHSPNNRSAIKFNFYGERDPKRLNLRFPKTYNFDGQLIDFCKEGTGPRPRYRCATPCYGCATPHSSADVVKFFNYLKTVFNAELHISDLFTDDDYLGTMTNWLQTTQSRTIDVWYGRVTHEEMTQVLECSDGIENMNLYCTPGPYFFYNKIISTGYLFVDCATWIKRHNLLNLDCDYVNVYGSNLGNEDLNAFLSHWLQSGEKKLKCMSIRGTNCSSEEEEKKNAYKFVQEEVLKGLPTLPGTPKRQDAILALRYISPHMPFETGMDLRRDSDGVLATVVVREEGNDGLTFTFAVWQEPDPNVVVVVP